ncbi:expressed unknown protein [Seminavis robusta]|uniref:Uncharacterized protein n=1 Tax=Seminavis robusta TaxID=568900 RepID=A0A9N8ET60_9STRA|nr:expressed unknown protein [Seminavis robusta]|eukprot:Sro1558_g282370.1 n/a (310) ;mRNA; r:12114-13279
MMKSCSILALLVTIVGNTAAFTTSVVQLASSSTTASTSALHAAATVPNPFKKLPWVAEKERQREARRMKMERAKLHRELGIVEDATYEEIVTATDNLIAAAGSDIKQKIKIEVAKDKILQIRLNERLAGLAIETSGARAQSAFERDGLDDDDAPKQGGDEWNAPLWTKGLIVKPDAAYRMQQLKLWGGITLLGTSIPPALDYMNRFTWLVCVAQLRFRGMPKEAREGGGMGISFGGGRGSPHGKVAWALGVSTWILGASLTYGLMPAWAKGRRYTAIMAFAMRNLIFGVVCSYLQPYKGGASKSVYDED